MSAGGGAYGRQPQSFHPPVRDAASIKYVLYGPGHEKFPSWPMTADADVPLAVRSPPTGGSQRSKSWTDHTDYPKQQPPPYTRPYMKRSEQQQLKTLVERYEKVSVADSNFYIHAGMEHRSKPIIKDMALPPERDRQKDLKLMQMGFGNDTIMSLTQADLEEYNKNLDETTLVQHQKQSSYAQSEGYYSYVSSSDSSSTPFIDSLKRDIDASISRVSSWDGESVATTRSGSVSSSETLKRRGSISDMSDVCNSSGVSPRQLIVHSARVQTPQKQSTESVLVAPRSFCDAQHLRRPSIETPTPPPPPPHRFEHHASSPKSYPVPVTPRKTVAECINLYEKKNIKVIQKKALLSYFERHQERIKKDVNTNDTIGKSHLIASQQFVSDLSMSNMKIQDIKSPVVTTDMPNSIFQGPVIMGPSISLDDWVPERPPKNKKLLDSILSENTIKSRKNPSHESMLTPSFSRSNNIAYKCDISHQVPIEKMKDCSAGMFLKPETPLSEAQKKLSTTSNFMHISAQKGREYPLSKQQLRSRMGSFNKHHSSHMNTTDRKSDAQILDKVPLKLASNMFKENESEISKLAPYRQGSFKYKPLVDTHGPFMNESFNKLNSTNKYLESSITMQKKKEQIHQIPDSPDHLVEISGRYRAEPLIIQSESSCQYNPHIAMSNSENKLCNSVHNINFPNYPKIHRSNSELNHGHFVQELPPYSSTLSMNSKTIFQNGNSRKLSYSESMNRSIVNTQFCRQNDVSVNDEAVINNRLYDTDLNGYQQTNLDSVYKKEKVEVQNENNKEKPLFLKKKPSVKSLEENNTYEELQTEPEKLTLESSNSLPIQNYNTPIKSVSTCDSKDEHTCDISEEKELIIPKSSSSTLPSDDTSKHLHLRKQLPEEIEWGCTKQIILHNFSENVAVLSLLSEFDECDKTMKLILDTFEVNIDNLDFVETLNDTETINTILTAKLEDSEKSKQQIENSSKNNKEKVEEYLTNLLKALEAHVVELESKMIANDELGMSIVNVLTKPNSARAGRLIKDVALITSLTSSLLSRYNRIQKSLKETSIDHQTMDKLELEKGRLSEKLEDAKTLKKDIENNRTKVFSVLEKELEGNLTNNYKSCINTKTRLVIYIKDVKDRIDIVKRLYKELNQDNSSMFLSNY